MKKIVFISLIIISALNLSAQEKIDASKARKEIRGGNKSFRDQLYGAAEGKYMEATKADPANTIAAYNLANTYYKQQRWDDALKEYQRYLTLEKQNPKLMSQAWSNIGSVYLKKKADERSKNNMQAQAGQMPTGQAQQQGNAPDNLQMSMEAYKNSLRIDPTDNDTRYNLAVVQKMIQDQKQDGGGGQNDKDKNKDKDKDKDKDKQDQNNKDQQKQDPPKQDKQNQNQMSQSNAEQILQALEQEEKQTQERVKEGQARQRQRQNANNKRQDKDW